MASKRRIRRKSCTGKVRHPDELAARRHIGALVFRKGERGLRAYRCPFCNGWHVGHGGRRWQ